MSSSTEVAQNVRVTRRADGSTVLEIPPSQPQQAAPSSDWVPLSVMVPLEKKALSHLAGRLKTNGARVLRTQGLWLVYKADFDAWATEESKRQAQELVKDAPPASNDSSIADTMAAGFGIAKSKGH